MTEIIFQSKRTMVVEIAGIVHFISTMPGKHARPFQTTISVNGSCCMMDGPLSVPDSCAAMTAVTMWALRRDSPSNTVLDSSGRGEQADSRRSGGGEGEGCELD